MQLQKAMMSAMRSTLTKLGEEYWPASVGNAKKLPLTGRRGEGYGRGCKEGDEADEAGVKGRRDVAQQEWPTQRLIKWAEKMVTEYRHVQETAE